LAEPNLAGDRTASAILPSALIASITVANGRSILSVINLSVLEARVLRNRVF